MSHAYYGDGQMVSYQLHTCLAAWAQSLQLLSSYGVTWLLCPCPVCIRMLPKTLYVYRDIGDDLMTSGLTNRRSLVQYVLEQVVNVIIQLPAMTTACKYEQIAN